MIRKTADAQSIIASEEDRYALGHDCAAAAVLSLRTVENAAAFVMPYLKTGMRLLDCGCGPGSISVGLAERVCPGEAVGIDISPDHLELARKAAEKQAVKNARFELGDVTNMVFPDASFDVVFMNAVLCHLTDPLSALREVHRVLRPGGLVAVRDFDYRGRLYWPEETNFREYLRLLTSLIRCKGGDPNIGSRLPDLLRQASFSHLQMSASFQMDSDTQAQAHRFELRADLLLGSMGQNMVEAGLADPSALRKLADSLCELGKCPGLFDALPLVEVIGWKE